MKYYTRKNLEEALCRMCPTKYRAMKGHVTIPKLMDIIAIEMFWKSLSSEKPEYGDATVADIEIILRAHRDLTSPGYLQFEDQKE